MYYARNKKYRENEWYEILFVWLQMLNKSNTDQKPFCCNVNIYLDKKKSNLFYETTKNLQRNIFDSYICWGAEPSFLTEEDVLMNRGLFIWGCIIIIFTFSRPPSPPGAAKPNSVEQKTSNSEPGPAPAWPAEAGAPEWKPTFFLSQTFISPDSDLRNNTSDNNTSDAVKNRANLSIEATHPM